MLIFLWEKLLKKNKNKKKQWRSRRKQVEALENLKPKEQTKPIEGKSNNQSKVKTIFDDFISKRKDTMNEL